MKYISIACFLMAAATTLEAAATLEAAVQPQTITKRFGATILQIKYVAQADDKSYFAEDSPARTWAQASEYCKIFNMKLATITSPSQLTALKKAAGDDFYGKFWTAGRDALQTRQFVWDTTGHPLNPEATIYRSEYSAPFQSCVYYSSFVSFWYMSSEPCTTPLGTLCET